MINLTGIIIVWNVDAQIFNIKKPGRLNFPTNSLFQIGLISLSKLSGYLMSILFTFHAVSFILTEPDHMTF